MKQAEPCEKSNQQELLKNIDDFIAHLKFEHRASNHTCLAYKRDLKQLADFLITSKVFKWNLLTVELLRQFFASLRHLKKARSLNRKRSTFRSFYNFLIQHSITNENPIQHISSFKTQKLLPKPLDVDQMAQLLSIQTEDFFSTRDRALFELIYSAGLRLAEALNIKINDIDLKQKQIVITGKGQKSRIGFIGQKALEALEIWLKVRDLHSGESKYLFITKKGQALSTRLVQQRLLKLGLKQGIQTRVHPHRLRHSFASHLLESSHDIRAVQELLGHANLSTTQIYTQLNFQHLASIYDKCHPRAKKYSNEDKISKED